MSFIKDIIAVANGLMAFAEKYGYIRLVKDIIFCILLAFTLFYVYDIVREGGSIIQRTQQEQVIRQEKEHNDNLQKRINISPEINKIMSAIVSDTGADRAFVIELHNGASNVAGLPFARWSMTYEVVAVGVGDTHDHFQNILLNNYSFPSYFRDNNFWVGNITDFKAIDARLYRQLFNDTEKEFAMTVISSEDHLIGYFGVVFSGGRMKVSETKLSDRLFGDVQKISRYLSNK